MHGIEQQSAEKAAELLMEHGTKASRLITFRPQNMQAAAEAVGHLAKRLADLPGAVRDSLERGRNSAAMLSGDRLQGLSEMIQNADDAGARQVRVALLGDGLWLSHDGESIQLEHVFGIAMPWITTKSDDPAATGRHGIGLMTLRALSSSLQVHCAPYHVQLDESALSAVDAARPPSWLAEEGWTILHVPLAIEVLNLESLHAWIEGWGHAGLLFLRRVTLVSLYDGTGNRVRELRLDWTNEGSFEQPIAGEDAMVDVRCAQDPEGRAYRVYQAVFASPEKIDRHGKAKADRTPIAVALPLYDTQENWLHAGLPVVKTQTRLRIGAQFDTLSNRQGLAPTDWNHWLVTVIAPLWLASIVDLLKTEAALAWALIPLEAPKNEKGSSLVADLEHEIWSVAGKPLAELAKVPAGGQDIAITQLAIEVPQLEPVLREHEVAALADCGHALPRALRDADRNWWHVLALWRQECETMRPPVDTERALALLDDRAFPIDRRIALSAVAIDEHINEALAARPCIALADESIVAPPRFDAPELLVLHAGTLAEELGIGLHLHPRYQGETPGSQTVLDWLRASKALMEEGDALALLKRLAQAGSSGKHIVKALTGSQLASLRDAFERISTDEQQSLGPAVGRAVRLEAFKYDEKKKEVALVCSPAQAYLPRAIDRDTDSFAVAAGKAPGLYWMSSKYAIALRSKLGRAGLGPQRFLRILGAELAPRLIGHSGLVDRYAADRRKGLSAGAGPATRSEAMLAIDAEYTLEDWESPDLQRVVADISTEKKYTQRRDRATALIAALARAWEQRLADRATVTAASTGGSWQMRGVLRAYWLWAAGNVEWLEDAKGTKRRPCDLRLRTPTSIAIYGSEGANYLRANLHTPARQQVLEALGVEGEASTAELVRHLRGLRAQAAGVMDERWETESAVVYQALAARFPSGRSATDMTSRTLLREFSALPGLILSKRGWRRPAEVLLGPPSFGNYRDYVPAVPHSENLWRALQIHDATIDDCLEVMKEVALRRKTLQGEEVAVVVATLRMMQEKLRTGRADALPAARMRKAPLWTTRGWTRERPVYAVSDTAIAEALADHIPVWVPGCEISNLSACLEPLGVKLITAGDAHVVQPEDADTDDEATPIFERAVSHLHEDLSRNDPQIAAALSIQWESLKHFEVKRHPDLHIRLVGVPDWSESKLIPVRAKADIEGSTLHVREPLELRRVESGARAIAALFDADPRKVAYAWLAAYDKAQEGIAAEEIMTAEEAQKLEEEKLAQNVLERTRQLQAETANRKAAKTGKPPKPTAPPAPQPPAATPPLKPRVLVDPNKLKLKQPHGEIQGKTQPPLSPEKRPPPPLPNPRSGSSPPTDRKSLPTFTGKTKETLGLELARRALQYDEGELRDLRAQMGLGADAVDGDGRFFELKVYLNEEPNSIHLTDSEVKRAASTPKFYLVIVSQLEGESAQPRIRVITDPLKQLGVSGNGGITLTNVKHASSLIFNYERGVEGAVGDSERQSTPGLA